LGFPPGDGQGAANGGEKSAPRCVQCKVPVESRGHGSGTWVNAMFDGRNPAKAVDMLHITYDLQGFVHTSQVVVWDFFHQQYV